MGRRGSGAVAIGGDPAVLTLREALEVEAPLPTLFWGRGLADLAEDLSRDAPARLVAPDVETARGVTVPLECALVPAPGDETRVALRLPSSREELEWRLAVAASRLQPGQAVWLAGHKREGIKAAAKTLEERIGPTVVARTKRHTRVLVATRRQEAAPEPDPARWTRRFEATFGDRTVVCETVPGAFAHGRLDEGTARLLRWLQDVEPAARVLDLGCGCGILGIALALRDTEARVDLVDAHVAAVESARRTLAANGLEEGGRVRVHLADAAGAPAGPYPLVVTNPPFHEGRRQKRTLAGSFAEAAAERLEAAGTFVVVANRHLGYRDDLEARFAQVDVPWEDGRYRIWRCRAPRG
ncbi:MAG: methyltransferase [Myxococcota bacterium]